LTVSTSDSPFDFLTMRHSPGFSFLLKSLASLSAIQASSFLLSFIVILYTVRIIGPEKFGIIVLAQVFVQYLTILVQYGFTVSSTREVSFHRDNIREMNLLFSGTLIIKTVLATASLIVVAVSAWLIQPLRAEFNVYFFTALTLIGEALSLLWMFQGLEKPASLLGTVFSCRTATAVAIVLIVRQPEDYYWIPLITSLGNILLSAVSLRLAFSRIGVRFVRVPIDRLLVMARMSTGFFLSRAAVTFYTTINTACLGLTLGNRMAGLYAAADKVIKILPDMFYPLYVALFAHFNQSFDETTKPDKIRLYRLCFGSSLLAVMAISGALFILADPIIRILYGQDFAPSANLLRLMVLAPVMNHLSSMIGGSVLIPQGFQRVFNSSIMIATACHGILLAGLFITGSISLETIALSAVIVETVIAVIRFRTILGHRNMRQWLVGPPQET